MSLEELMTDIDSSRLFKRLASCLAHIGKRDFFETFLNIVEDVVRADQCTVFSYISELPICYLSYNPRTEAGDRLLVNEYLSYGYKADPLIKYINRSSLVDGFAVFTYDELKEEMNQEYIQKFFKQPGMIDKISIIAQDRGETLIANFYRYNENGKFSRSNPELREAFWRIIMHLLLLHYSSKSEVNLKSPLSTLSDREREVCKGIMRGLTTEGIAGDLNIAPSSVTTYRKRSYSKLGINSKPALFALCRKN